MLCINLSVLSKSTELCEQTITSCHVRHLHMLCDCFPLLGVVFSLLFTPHGRIAGTMLLCYFNKMMCTVYICTMGCLFVLTKTRPKGFDLTLGNKSVETCGNP